MDMNTQFECLITPITRSSVMGVPVKVILTLPPDWASRDIDLEFFCGCIRLFFMNRNAPLQYEDMNVTITGHLHSE